MRPLLWLPSKSLLASLLLLVLLAGSARASHYAVGDVPRIITPEQATKLKKAGVETTEQLLTKAATAKRCDLLRIKGVGSEMVLLLEAAGVETSADLAKRDAPGLTTAVISANKDKKITEKLPTEPQLADWIDQAKKLPQILEPK